MGQYAGDGSQWIDNVYQFEQTDPVQGGTNGVDNLPLKNLADRTAWLKEQIGVSNRLTDQVTFTSDATITGALAGYLIIAQSLGVMNLQLDYLSNFAYGSVVPIVAYCNLACVVNVKTAGGQPIFGNNGAMSDSGGSVNIMYMHNNEQLCLIALGDHWQIQYTNGNFFTAGEELKGRKEMLNTIALKGQLLSRAQYPRLWAFVSSKLSMYQEKFPEFYWLFDPITYRGFFTEGDGSTNFRLPDERGMFERMIDLGRGVDLSRVGSYAGGYEADAFKAHKHGVNEWGDNKLDGVKNVRVPQSNKDYGIGYGNWAGALPTGPEDIAMEVVGDPYETRPKNIGKLNLIRF